MQQLEDDGVDSDWMKSIEVARFGRTDGDEVRDVEELALAKRAAGGIHSPA